MLARGVTSSRVHHASDEDGDEGGGSDEEVTVTSSNLHFEARTQLQIERLERSLVATQRRGDLLEESRLCNNIAKKYEELSRWRQALSFHLYDRQISEAAGDREGVLLAMGNMARVLQAMGQRRLARGTFGEQLQAAERAHLHVYSFQAQCSLALLAMEEAEEADHYDAPLVRRERLDEATIALMRAREALEQEERELGERLLAASTIKARREEVEARRLEVRLYEGQLAALRGDHPMAILALTLVQASFHEIGDVEREFAAWGYLGQVHGNQGEWKVAIEMAFDRQLALARSVGDAQLEAAALRNLGVAYQKLHDFDLALETLYLHLDHVKGLGDEDEIREATHLLETTLGMKEKSEEFVRLKGRRSKGKKVEALTRLAKLAHQLAHHEDALKYVRLATEAAGANGEGLSRSHLLYRLAAQIFLKADLVEDALYYAKKYEGEILALARGPGQARADVAILLADIYWRMPTMPIDCLRLLEEAWARGREERLLGDRGRRGDNRCDPDASPTDDEEDDLSGGSQYGLPLLNRLALTCERLGEGERYARYREEALGLWAAEEAAAAGPQETRIERDLIELDYFANRKASRSVMRLVDGNFAMCSRVKGRGRRRGPQLRAPRRTDQDGNSTARGPIPRTKRRRRPPTIIPEDGDDDNYNDGNGKDADDDFIDDSAILEETRRAIPELGDKSESESESGSGSESKIEPKPESEFGLQPTSSKCESRGDRSRTVGNKRRGRPTFPSQRRETGAAGTWQDSAVSIGGNPECVRWDPSQGQRVISSPSACNYPPQDSPDRPQTRRRVLPAPELSTIAAVLRVTVLILDMALVVPIVDDIAERKTVAWLMEEIIDRYREATGREPILEALLTEEGARLSPGDPVAIVLRDGQRLKALAPSFRTKRLVACYEERCQLAAGRGIKMVSTVREQLLLAEASGVLVLWPARPNFAQMELVSQALTDYWEVGGSLQTLDLSQTAAPILSMGEHYRYQRGEASEERGAFPIPIGSPPLRMASSSFPVRFSLLGARSLLRCLNLSYSEVERAAWIVSAFPGLQELSLAWCTRLTDGAELVQALGQTSSSSSSASPSLASASASPAPSDGCGSGLRCLCLAGTLRGVSVAPLGLLPALEHLDLSWCQQLHQVTSLQRRRGPQLRHLSLVGATTFVGDESEKFP